MARRKCKDSLKRKPPRLPETAPVSNLYTPVTCDPPWAFTPTCPRPGTFRPTS